MSDFTQKEQTEIVKKACELTTTIRLERENLEELKSDGFRLPPPPPQKRTVTKKTATANMPPEITVKYSFFGDFLKDRFKHIANKLWLALGIAGAVLLILIIASGVIGAAIGLTILFTVVPPVVVLALIVLRYKLNDEYQREKKLKNYAANNTPEMLQARENAISEAKKKQAEYDIEYFNAQAQADNDYKEEKQRYDTVTLPEYEKEKSSWELAKKAKMRMLSEDLVFYTDELNKLYDSTMIIAKKYREEASLAWLYENMSTSDWDIRYACERLDFKTSAQIQNETKNILNNMITLIHNGFNTTNIMLNDLCNSVEYGNELSEEQYELLRKTRRENNIGNIISILQNHKINKKL